MFEGNSDLIILGIGIIIAILLLKFIGKILFRVVGVIIILGLGLGYLYFFTNFFEEHKDNPIIQKVEEKIEVMSVLEYQRNTCKDGPKTRVDSITCECIIAPLVEELRTKFTGSELSDLELDKQKYLKEIFAALKKHQSEIIDNLKERDAIDIWNRIVKNLKRGKIKFD